MPRVARIRKKGAYYHIMCHSNSELLLFRDDKDKIKYLNILRRTLDEFNSILLAYSLMDNHLHLLLNPINADISKFMKKVNVSYAMYYNKKYNRKGSVFAGRFKSKIIDSEQYFLIVSLYIHNNAKDIDKYTISNVHNYRFSSFSYYLGYTKDEFEIVNKELILSYLHRDYESATNYYNKLNNIYNKLNNPDELMYSNLTNMVAEEKIYKYLSDFNKENSYEYISGKYIKLVNTKPEEIITAVCNYFNLPDSDILKEKYNKTILNYKAICCVFLRSMCDLTRKQICDLFGNITISNVYYLCKKGTNLLNNPSLKNQIYDEIMSIVA